MYMLKKSTHENVIAEDPVKSRAFFNIFTRALFGLHSSGYSLRGFLRGFVYKRILSCVIGQSFEHTKWNSLSLQSDIIGGTRT